MGGTKAARRLSSFSGVRSSGPLPPGPGLVPHRASVRDPSSRSRSKVKGGRAQ